MGVSFNQPERESLLELLHFAIYADHHISLIEEDLLTRLVGGLGWESPRPQSVFLLLTSSHVRALSARSEEEIDAWLADRLRVFGTEKTRAAALSVLNRLIRADGTSQQDSALAHKLEGLSASVPV